MSSYDQLDHAFSALAIDAEIREVLRQALSRKPNERPENISVLLERFFKAGADKKRQMPDGVVFLSIPRGVSERLQKQFRLSGSLELEKLVSNELSADVAYRLRETADEDRVRKIAIYAQELVFTCVVEQTTVDHLVLTNAIRKRASEIGRDREHALSIDLKLSLGRPSRSQGSTKIISALIQTLEEHEAGEKEKDQYRAEEAIFRTWLNVLRAKDDLETKKEQPIRYASIEIDETRVLFSSEKTVDESIVGQRRLVRLPQGRFLRGEIESVSDKQIVLWTERRWQIDDIPRRGDLILDTTVGRIPVQRQLDALAATRFGRARRPELRNFIIDPSKVAAPSIPSKITFIQDDLDDDKKAAIRTVLGNKDVVVVHGPPGTGKTKIITEVVGQICRANPKARVLLTSQTNVALDNALERIFEIAPEIQTVRIGRRDDPRISDSVRNLLLDNKSEAWIKEIRSRNDVFLSNWAIENNVKREDIQLGIAAGRLRTIRQREQMLRRDRAGIESDLEGLSVQLKALEERRTSDTYYDLNSKIDNLGGLAEKLDDQLDAVRKDRREAAEVLSKFGGIGQDLARMSVSELIAWEKGLLDQGASGERFRQLVELSEEWILRLGRPEEFHAAFLLTAQVVAATCIGIAGVRGIGGLEFDVCILDEASKALATESLVPMSLARSWILVGDDKQLPPFVDSALLDQKLLLEFGLSQADLTDSVFTRFSAHLPPENVTYLTTQYRMVKPIGDLVSECFYDGKLNSKKDKVIGQLRLAFPKPVTWYSTSKHPNRTESPSGTTFSNGIEAKIITDTIRRIEFVGKQLSRRFSVAVITGYRGQVQEIVRRVSGLGHLEYVTFECNSVDAFQGREADITLYSVTRSNDRLTLGFLRERRRLNVALSRGKDGLVIVGDHQFCESASGDNPFASVIRYLVRHPETCAIDLDSK